MEYVYILVLVILLTTDQHVIGTEFPYPLSAYVTGPGDHVCQTTHYEETKYYTSCSFWKWGRCTRYGSVRIDTYFCCDGYQNWFDDLRECKNPICNKRINGEGNGACTQYYRDDFIKYRSGLTESHSGGTCVGPEQCDNCNDGFYPSGGMCNICPDIDHCWHRKCSTPWDNICEYCDGEILERQYWRAYTSATDNKKSCQQACSWRSDSTRCYPGKCESETSASCVCMQGFTGRHCEEIMDEPTITDQQAVLEDGSLTVENPFNPSEDYSPPSTTVWTNQPGLYYANAYFTGLFKVDVPVGDLPPTPDSTGQDHYVTDFKYGIIGGSIQFSLYRDAGQVYPVYSSLCDGSALNPTTDQYTCSRTLYFSQWGNFRHNDQLYFDLSVSNGGYVKIMNRENNNNIETHYLRGKTHERQFMYHFDMELPYQSCAESGGTGCVQAVTAPDLTDDPSVTFSWDGWADDLSGLDRYEYEVFSMRPSQGYLMEDSLINGMPVTVPDGQTSSDFLLTTPGMYMLLLHAIDQAGNLRSARKVVLFDDQSVVEKQHGRYARVTTASPATDYEWVIQDTNTVDLVWPSLFINQRHRDNQWLNGIRPYAGVDPNYDDHFGNRTIDPIDHVLGIVDFWVSFEVYTGDDVLKDSQDFRSIKPDIHDEADQLIVDWEDGDKLNMAIRAIDVMDQYDEEMLTVYRDATPPVIDNLWLTRDGRTNLSVHSLEDFTQMTIEWDTFDYHSGIDTLNWKLFDNFTQDVIQHGHEDLISQREQNLSSCQATYGGEPGDCYCTQFHGCYHQHFAIQPDIKVDAGLVVGLDQGIHDYDYFIEVSVTNIAQLTTTLSKKISIDISPPHAGVVHDGVPGTLEVDYQQSQSLTAHWDGFFDRESGVKMYVYKFDTQCQTESVMVLDSADPDVIETTATMATHTVSSDGTYYTTVVAFNSALEPSVPVCSDGVSVDNSIPAVEEIIVDGAMVRDGLVTDGGDVWILGTDRSLRKLNVSCLENATVISDLDLFPRERFSDGSEVLVDGEVFCDNTTASPSPVFTMLGKSSNLMVSWTPVTNTSGVFDYEFGISSSEMGKAAPDMLAFFSTKQNPHVILRHSDIPTGTEFFFAIKTISKAEVENIQTLGPCFMDTTAPEFSGTVALTFESDHLVASWPPGSFLDAEEYYDLFYTFAIGHNEYGTDIQPYEPLREGASCVLTETPVCTAVPVSDLDWDLHGHHTYYATIRAENSVNLNAMGTSQPYIHDVQLAAKGVVIDTTVGANKESIPFTDIEDVDFQTDRTTVQARWSGFEHPHLDVTYSVSVGTTSFGSDIYGPISVVDTNNTYEITGLTLVSWQTYFFTVEASTSVGNVQVSSDGVTVVEEGAVLSGIEIFDGRLCNMTVDDGTRFKHHEQDNRVRCNEERDFQTSLNSIQAYWTIPPGIKYYTPDVHWAVEVEDIAGAGVWSEVRDFEHISTKYEAEAHDLVLLPGRSYRVAVQFCAGEICFAPLHSDGVLVLSSPPVTGSLSVTHLNTTDGGGVEKLHVEMDKFYDPDIANPSDQYDAIEKYEWAITDDSPGGKVYTKWTNLDSYTETSEEMTFQLTLTGVMDFSRCKRFSVRGYNKAGLWSLVSRQVLFCDAFDPKLIIPNVVIDAVGEQEYDITGTLKDGYGKGISLPENAHWNEKDVDYTPYKNIISAVWPDLRHRNYTYAVLRASSIDVTTYYQPTNQLSLPDPCSHVDTIACGRTEVEYVNVVFNDSVLLHGSRYIVCIHADSVSLPQETYPLPIAAVSTCSDGVVVDLTGPTKGDVWIGHTPDTQYLTTTTSMFVNWETFVDVEELSSTSHSTGIQYYTIAIGTTAGGNDIVDFTNVGVVNHVAFHGLTLQNGHTFYANLTATDFVGRVTTAISPAVKIDVTPPIKSDKPIIVDGRHITSLTEIGACWTEVFSDLESGILRYMWAIGSKPGYDDIMTFTDIGDVTCAISDKDLTLDLHEGHAYYITVRAYNGAGLSSQAESWALVVDLTPPTPGHVYDGKPGLHPDNQKDLDIQTDRSYLAAFWEGFHDSHSNIREYSVSVGTCKMCQDVLETQDIGITNEFVLTQKHLGVGLTYYTTVTACNTADLCTAVTSDGVILDNSPPTKGIVMDGTLARDIHYQATQTFIGAKWYGFSDPQSGLDHYEWWAGTTIGGEEVMSKSILHLSEVATNPSIPTLPVGKPIYITVRAYNKAGISVDSTSNGFTVDTSAPVISKPQLSPDLGSITDGSIVLRSSFKVFWTATDEESHIESQYLSIKAHRGGEFQLSSTKVSGIVRDFIFTGLDLHDGINYYVNLIACNGAGICSQEESDAIFVDSTPPSRGMFAIHTAHAANLDRHRHNYMTWTKRAIYLAWLGFSDLHSNVEYYMINVGSTYMDSDLNERPSEPTKVYHSDMTEEYEEGHLQWAQIVTQDLSRAPTSIFINMWAVNRVGLASAVIHSMFNRFTGGVLELVRRCTAYSCLGHCVCAPQDQVCPYSTMDPCSAYTAADNPNSPIDIKDVTNFRDNSGDDESYTPTNMLLGAYWRISNIDGLEPLWYEWSIGYYDLDDPDGVFDPIDDRVWHDSGLVTYQRFALPREMSTLSEGVKYAFFVRVWYSYNTYATYKTNGITIATRAPTPTRIQGSAVTESNWDYSHKDMDYLEYLPFTVSWTNKFLMADTYIRSFQVYLSTSPGGNDTFSLLTTLPGTSTSYDFKRYKLTSHVKYYSNIVAYSFSGIHHTESSDGFIIDNSPPIMGTVYDGTGVHDIEYQSSTSVVGAVWHGFVDVDSGVMSYYWCVGDTQVPTECSVLPWEAVHLRTAVRANLSTVLSHGMKIYNKVYAVDALGQQSDTAVSDGVTVDTTAPIPQTLVHQDSTNLINNPSFETTKGNTISWSIINGTDICSVNSTHHPLMWESTWDSCVVVVSSDINLARDGMSMVMLRGTLSQEVTGLIIGDMYRVTFFTSHLPVVNSVIANKEGFVEFGDRHIFLMYTKAYRHDDHGTDSREIISWHLHTFYFVAHSTEMMLYLGSMDKGTGILFDDIRVHHVTRIDDNNPEAVNAHIVVLHEWGSLHGSWSFVEPESHITEYLWAIGYKQGGTQVQDFRSVGQQTFAYNDTLSLVHKSHVYITVVATSTTGLQGVSYSPPLLVDLTPPNITEVNDGSGTGTNVADLDSWQLDELLVNWKVTDPESGLDFCEWAVGYQPFGIELQTFQRMPDNVFTGKVADVTYERLEGRTVYSTIRCTNQAGLQSVKSSDGVRISNLSPSIDNVQFVTVGLSKTEFTVAPFFQSVNEQVRMRWSSFTDNIGLEGYDFVLDGVQRRILTYGEEQTYIWVHGLALSDDVHYVTLSAVNLQQKISPKVTTNFTVFTQEPTLNGSHSLDVSWDSTANELTVSWDRIFVSDYDLYYEVSAGSVFGGADVIQWQETMSTVITFGIPPTITDLSNLRIYIVVRAVTKGGTYLDKWGSVTLPG